MIVNQESELQINHATTQPWIVCMGGEDWWYHSHAHFDIQVMKRLAQRCRVLYICSIGMRMPSLRKDAQFWRKISNKWQSVRHAMRRVQPNLWVYSPLPVPLYQWRWGRSINCHVLRIQLKIVFDRLGIREPIFWINTPTAWPVVETIKRCGLIYQRTDEYAEYGFDNFNAAYVQSVDQELLTKADLVLHVDPDLHERAARHTNNTLLFEQGVDEAFFIDDSEDNTLPSDWPPVSGPVVGYVGTLDPHKFDAELVYRTAIQLLECQFVIIGPEHQNAMILKKLKNVHFLGYKPHGIIAQYIRKFDVCMLPTARTSWGLHCRPIKLMEYLAAGRPVIATRTPAAESFREFVSIAETADEWAKELRRILTGRQSISGEIKQRLSQYSWNQQVDRIWRILQDRSLFVVHDHESSVAHKLTETVDQEPSSLPTRPPMVIEK